MREADDNDQPPVRMADTDHGAVPVEFLSAHRIVIRFTPHFQPDVHVTVHGVRIAMYYTLHLVNGVWAPDRRRATTVQRWGAPDTDREATSALTAAAHDIIDAVTRWLAEPGQTVVLTDAHRRWAHRQIHLTRNQIARTTTGQGIQPLLDRITTMQRILTC
jgi:hypothetical protein